MTEHGVVDLRLHLDRLVERPNPAAAARTMDIGHAAKPVHEDRISKLDDAVLGHVLSFLPSKQAARAAALSSRWRDAFAGVHTVSLEEPEGGVPPYQQRCRRGSDDDDRRRDPPSRFGAVITAAIVARHRRLGATATPPLRAIRVALHNYRYRDAVAVDLWVSYALMQEDRKSVV